MRTSIGDKNVTVRSILSVWYIRMVLVGVIVVFLRVAFRMLVPSLAAPNHAHVTPSILTSPDQVRSWQSSQSQSSRVTIADTHGISPRYWKVTIRSCCIYPGIEVRRTYSYWYCARICILTRDPENKEREKQREEEGDHPKSGRIPFERTTRFYETAARDLLT